MSKERNETMCTLKRKYTHRISVWALLFAVVFCAFSVFYTLPAFAMNPIDGANRNARHTAGGIGDVVRGAGNVASDVVEGVGNTAGKVVRGASDAAGNAVDDVLDMTVSEGRVRDGDGIIGNEGREGTVPSESETGGRMGSWLAWSIAVIVALIVIAMVVILIPKKKTE